MHVAEIEIVCGRSWAAPTVHKIGFAERDKAEAEYKRLADLVTKEVDVHNDKPTIVECVGDGCSCSMPLRDITSVGWMDYAETNNQRFGVEEAFPSIFRRR